MPMPEVLFQNTSRAYPNFNTSVPDPYRFQQFKQEFDERYVRGKEPMPQFIWLPNDHTAKPRPNDGCPYRAFYVADNDLALGKMIALLFGGWRCIVYNQDFTCCGVPFPP